MAEMTEFDTKYDGFLPTYQALAEEVKFILKGFIADNQIKIHDVECRVKEKQSVLKKSVEKDFEDPLSDLNYIIGARVICLFRDDMKKIDALVKDNFNVISIDDKINGTSEAFGYMSVRYIFQIKSEYAGYRYKKLKNFKFEIQARTLCMHAWAVVSHYLDYKGDWDVPAELKRSLNALSALFYVADTEFEAVSSARQASLQSAQASAEKAGVASGTNLPQEVNLDTVMAYLAQRFPDRSAASDTEASELVKELKQAGYQSLGQIAADIDRAEDAFKAYEEDRPPNGHKGRKYAASGAARLSLGISSRKYGLMKYSSERWGKYRKLLRAPLVDE